MNFSSSAALNYLKACMSHNLVDIPVSVTDMGTSVFPFFRVLVRAGHPPDHFSVLGLLLLDADVSIQQREFPLMVHV